MHRARIVTASFVVAAGILGCPKPVATTPGRTEKPSKPHKLKIEKRKLTVEELASSAFTREDEALKSVYPVKVDAPHPLAQRLCSAVWSAPEARRSTCCSSPKRVSVGDLEVRCVAAVSSALTDGAVHVDDDALQQCEAAVDAATREGCAWVSPGNFVPPPSCTRLIAGRLARGKGCRSSLECVGTDHCRGVSPSAEGVCTKSVPAGAPCNTAVDPLVARAWQSLGERDHAACEGFCRLNRCAALLPVGEACSSSRRCVPTAHCAEAVCKAEAPGLLGEACRDGTCTPGLRCVADRCVGPGGEGAACLAPGDCVGGCVKEPGKREGRCGMKCKPF